MDSKNTLNKYGVVGAGSFGITIANLLSQNGDVLMYARSKKQVDEINLTHHSKGYDLNERITAINNLKELAGQCQLIFPIIPSDSFVSLLDEIAPYLSPSHILIHGTKGLYTPKKILTDTIISKEDIFTMSSLIRRKTGVVRIGCLAGPNLASELAENQPAATVIASKFDEVIRLGHNALRSNRFQVYGSNDILGIELAGVLKNYIAIASGMLSGLNYGENARALLITRGLDELIVIAKSLGATEKAFLGIAGIGDLIATCNSSKSRNYRVGYNLAKGKKLDEIITEIGEVAEGIKTLQIVKQLQVHGYKAPIAEILYRIIFQDMPIHKGINLLMSFSTKNDTVIL